MLFKLYYWLKTRQTPLRAFNSSSKPGRPPLKSSSLVCFSCTYQSTVGLQRQLANFFFFKLKKKVLIFITDFVSLPKKPRLFQYQYCCHVCKRCVKIQDFYLIGKKTILTYSTKEYLLKSAISNKRVGPVKYSSLTLT